MLSCEMKIIACVVLLLAQPRIQEHFEKVKCIAFCYSPLDGSPLWVLLMYGGWEFGLRWC